MAAPLPNTFIPRTPATPFTPPASPGDAAAPRPMVPNWLEPPLDNTPSPTTAEDEDEVLDAAGEDGTGHLAMAPLTPVTILIPPTHLFAAPVTPPRILAHAHTADELVGLRLRAEVYPSTRVASDDVPPQSSAHTSSSSSARL